MTVDTTNWSGEGAFTQTVVDHLQRLDAVELLRVEDAPASRSEADYNFISNEIYVRFTATPLVERAKLLGVLPTSRTVLVKTMDVKKLEQTLTAIPEIGAPDYSDETMLQYLRSERIIPPYQTRGYKLVELLRIYEVAEVATTVQRTPRNKPV
jgi:hypothetical protein